MATSYYARGEYAKKMEETAQQNSNMRAARAQQEYQDRLRRMMRKRKGLGRSSGK